MFMQRQVVSPTVTRYYVSAILDPGSLLLLVTPEQTIVASWTSRSGDPWVGGQWVSPCSDLEAVVVGTENGLPIESPRLTVIADENPRSRTA